MSKFNLDGAFVIDIETRGLLDKLKSKEKFSEFDYIGNEVKDFFVFSECRKAAPFS